MEKYLILGLAFIIIAVIVSTLIGKKRSWGNFKFLEGEKVELEEDGIKVNFSAPPRNTYVKAQVKITNKRIIIVAANLFNRQGTVWWVFNYASSLPDGSLLGNSLKGEYYINKKDIKIERDEDGREYLCCEGKMSERIYRFKIKMPLVNLSRTKEIIGLN